MRPCRSGTGRCWFLWRKGKRRTRRKILRSRREPTTNVAYSWPRVRDSNPGHIGGGQCSHHCAIFTPSNQFICLLCLFVCLFVFGSLAAWMWRYWKWWENIMVTTVGVIWPKTWCWIKNKKLDYTCVFYTCVFYTCVFSVLLIQQCLIAWFLQRWVKVIPQIYTSVV